ncbi:MAG TPA: ribonuclease HII [Fimbriimonas sp.]|nr:ribonuclease HII [Fimbriimonas sp.]
MNALLEHYPNAAGADEAGRGPLAGPVVAAAVILPDRFDRTGIADSKILTAKAREEQEERIKAEAIWAVEVAWTDEVDRLNILHASLEAMSRAAFRLSMMPCIVLIDGNKLPKKLPCEGKAVIGGDGKYACIAAASILAKTERDRIMTQYAVEFPDYGFDKHFGYATPEHRKALAEHGPCAIHRRTFAPVQELLQPSLLDV